MAFYCEILYDVIFRAMKRETLNLPGKFVRLKRKRNLLKLDQIDGVKLIEKERKKLNLDTGASLLFLTSRSS